MNTFLKQLAFAIIAILFVHAPAHAQTNGDIVDRLNTTLGVRLPVEFEAKVKDFAANNTIMRTRSATAFTEQFIIEQFKNDWGIDRQNQLLFMWSTIYSGITNKTLYEFLDDDNEARSDEYFNQLENINKFYESYEKGFEEYMDQKSAELDKKSAELDKQSVEALTSSLKNLAWFFNRYHMKDKAAIPPDEVQAFKDAGTLVFTWCKEENFNYKAILRKELGDEQKVKDLLKFYGIE